MLWAAIVVLILGLIILGWLWLTRVEPPAPKQLSREMGDFHVVSSHWDEDVSWLHDLDMSVSVCDKKGNPRYAGTGDCDVPANKGRECSAYVQWIVNHYDNLPKRVAFVHGHQSAWHQQNKLPEMLRLAREKLPEGSGYTSLNDMTLCLWRRCPRRFNLMCDSEKRHNVMPFWDEHIVPYLQDQWPTECCSAWGDCCAQFVVDREDILRLPKASYEAILRDLLAQKNDVEMCFGLETVWHAIFGQKICAEWNGDCPIDHTIGSRLQGEPDAPECLTDYRP